MAWEEEQRQYNEFCCKLALKAKEIDEDYKKLSPQNKIRFNDELKKMVVAGGVEEILRRLQC